MEDTVALLAEGVGRNLFAPGLTALGLTVALLAEGVGRNHVEHDTIGSGGVALLAEGVGRNTSDSPDDDGPLSSPSSRRAWVEIYYGLGIANCFGCRPPRGGRG